MGIEEFKDKITCMDCMEGLKRLPDKCVDMVLTDPPYNISRKTNFSTMKGHRGTSMDFGEWDKNADFLSFISLLPRILKTGANVVIHNAWENLGTIANEMRKFGIEPKKCIVLRKSNPAPFNRERLFANDVEFAVWGVFKNQDWTFNRFEKIEKCVVDTTVQHKRFHPTMKDLKVMKRLVRILSREGDVVLDPFIGSGTTALACKQLNRKFIGFEINQEYCNIAKRRLAECVQPLSAYLDS